MYISIILAAGEGTRMKSSLSKVLHTICGKEIVKYVIDEAKNSGISKNVVVLGHNIDQAKDCLKGEVVDFVKQPVGEGHPYGTGFAVMCAESHISDDDTVLILCGDGPLITNETLKGFMSYHDREKCAVSVLTCNVANPKGLGRIVRNVDQTLNRIIEQKDANEEELAICEINTGIICFNGKKLKETLKKLDRNNSNNEYYITDTIKILNEEGNKVGAFLLENEEEIKAINDRVQLAEVTEIMRKRINEFHMRNGVTIIDPKTTYIDSNVEIGKDTIIYAGSIIEINTTIGEDCIIGPNSRIINSVIKDNVTVDSSKLIEAFVDENTVVGPFAYLREGSKLGKDVKIGDFVEVKNSTIQDGTKASHLAYIGDAEVGKNVNIGCGVVFVNYTGKSKGKTIVEDGAFIGSNSNLVAPITIGEGAYIAGGSTIVSDVEKDDLAIARARQVNKPGKGKGRF